MSTFLHRRQFLSGSIAGVLAGVTCSSICCKAAGSPRPSLEGVIGITTGGLDYQRINRLLTVFTLPKFMRDDLGMQMIDLNTRWLETYDQTYINRVREAADNAGCFFSNLKVNHKFGDLYSSDAAERKKAMTNARQLVIVAKTLGARWIRFTVPHFSASDGPLKLAAHRELASFAEQHNVQLIVENGGWLKSDPDSIVRVVEAIGHNVAAGPDTGNWDDDVRYDALKKSFPDAATCDFKVFGLDNNYHHDKYDIRRCFEVGWKVGFRGPWAIEHWNDDTKAYARETTWLRDQLTKWMVAEK